MATFLISSRVCSFSCHSTRSIGATINVPNIKLTKISTPKTTSLVAQLDYLNHFSSSTTKQDPHHYSNNTTNNHPTAPSINSTSKSMEIVKLHMITEIVADRIEMHKNIGVQRDNWNRLMLHSINMITLSASSMVGIAATSPIGAPLLALKVSSTILFMAATGLLYVMNRIQPSQLAEEQRNAARLFKQLHGEIRTKVSIGNPNESDVNEAMEKVLALDKAYPLPLLGAMLEKFPKNVEPAVWWPNRMKKKKKKKKEEGLFGKLKGKNGWDEKLEGEMRSIVGALRKKDMAEYLRLGEKVLSFNKVLAFSGPILTGLAAIGSACSGSVSEPFWPVMLGLVGGSLASVVNTIEHGGQVGMVFELYRATSGFFKLMEESIEVNVNEEDHDRRENGELFEIKVALQLGRSLSELRRFATAISSSDEDDACEEFASKLF